MKKYIAAILLVVPLFAFAHTDGTPHHEISADTGLLQQIQQQLNASVTTQSTDTGLVGSLKVRQKQLIELAKQSPATALRFVVPATTRSKQSAEAQKYIEQAGSLSGTLEVIHVDDFDNPENSYYMYAVNNGGVKTNVYTVKEISSRSGTKVSLQGYKLNATEFLTDGKNVSLSAMPDVGAVGKQRLLVILVNSVSEPGQPVTTSQVENFIDNGQFQKFIKEASYGKTWFETKAYGWLTLTDPNVRLWCGMPDKSNLEVQAFLRKNSISLTNFDRLLFLSTGAAACSEVGKNWGGDNISQAWISMSESSFKQQRERSFSWTYFDFLLAHELGHSLGLWHANGFDCGPTALSGDCKHVEYGNNYDVMGNGEYSLQFNGYYKEILGWIKPENILNINKSGRYTFSHVELPVTTSQDKKFAKLYNPAISTVIPQLMLESRYPIGFDADVDETVLVTVPAGTANNPSSRLIDTNPSGQEWYVDDANAGIQAGQTFVDRAGGFLIGKIFSQTATSTTIDIRVDPPSCVRSGLNYTDERTDFVSRNSNFNSPISFRNNDSALCGKTVFDFDVELPTGWKLVRKSDPVEIKPGESGYVYFDLLIQANASLGDAAIRYYATNKTTGQRAFAGEDRVEVFEGTIVSGISPNPAKAGDTVTILAKNHNQYAKQVVLSSYTNGFWVGQDIPARISDDRIVFDLPTKVVVERGDIEKEEPLPNGDYTINIAGYGNKIKVPLRIGSTPLPNTSSTIQNVQAITNATPALAYKYERYPITWEGTNLSKVNIDLYDLKGLYKIKTIDEDYDVTFSKEKQTFTYDWYVSGSALKDDIYTIKITDALNKKVKNTSPKVTIQKYQAPTIGTAQSVGSATARVATVSGGREIGFVGNFEIKINAVADSVLLPVAYGFFADAIRTAPLDKPGEYSTKSVAAKIDSMTGDATLTKDVKGNDAYKILKGKSATFKISTVFKPEEMFAGQYNIVLNYINAQNSQGKEGIVTFTPPKTPVVTIIGEKAPHITSVNNPVKANLPAIIEGVRFSPTENILIVSGGQQYKLKGAVNNKITFIPSEIGLAPGEYGFQIDSIYGKSNYEWLDIKEATNAANIFTAVWDLISGWFRSKPKPAVPAANPVDVSTPSIKVVFPDKAEEWTVGKTYNIAFDVTGDVGTRIIRLNRYSDDGIRLGSEEIGTTMADSFSFTVPANIATTIEDAPKYKIEVLSSKYNDGIGVADESDTYFMIRSIETVDF